VRCRINLTRLPSLIAPMALLVDDSLAAWMTATWNANATETAASTMATANMIATLQPMQLPPLSVLIQPLMQLPLHCLTVCPGVQHIWALV